MTIPNTRPAAALVTKTVRTARRIVPQAACRDDEASPERNFVSAAGRPRVPQASTRFVALRTKARSPYWTSPRILATAIDSRSPRAFTTITAANDVIVPLITNRRALSERIKFDHRRLSEHW